MTFTKFVIFVTIQLFSAIANLLEVNMTKFVLLILSMFVFNTLFSQKILSDIDEIILSDLFENNLKHNLSELIERNEASEITRKWEFNFAGKIIRETDFRGGGWVALPPIRKIPKSKNGLKEFSYFYHPNGHIDRIVQREITDQKEINTVRKFEYLDNTTIQETWSIKKIREFIDMEFEEVTKFKEGVIDSTIFKTRTYLGDGYTGFTKTNIFEYDSDKKMKDRKGYFAIKSYPGSDTTEIREYHDSKSEYFYDRLGKLIKIIDSEFNEKKEEKIARIVKFQYKKSSHLVNQIEVYGENYIPKETVYKINYNSKGRVEKVAWNENIYFYELKERN